MTTNVMAQAVHHIQAGADRATRALVGRGRQAYGAHVDLSTLARLGCLPTLSESQFRHGLAPGHCERSVYSTVGG